MARDIAYTIAEQAFLQGYMKTANPDDEVARIRAQHADIRKTRALRASEERELLSARVAQRNAAKAARRGDSVQATQAAFAGRPDRRSAGYVPEVHLAADEPNRTGVKSTDPTSPNFSAANMTDEEFARHYPQPAQPAPAATSPATYGPRLPATATAPAAYGPRLPATAAAAAASAAPQSLTPAMINNPIGAPARFDQATRNRQTGMITPTAPMMPAPYRPPVAHSPYKGSNAPAMAQQQHKLNADRNNMLNDYQKRTDRTPEGDAWAEQRLANIYRQEGTGSEGSKLRARQTFASRFSR
jgi:hypothetical protein